MPHPQLSKAPIVEALIDIRVSLPKTTQIQTLKDLNPRVKDAYPETQERRKWAGKIELKDGDVQAFGGGADVDGYLFKSTDKSRVVQFRLDGFTYSKLKPYTNWNEFRGEAERLWGIYKTGATPISLSRMAVRYINSIPLPPLITPDTLSEYINYAPTIHKDLKTSLNAFFQRDIICRESGACAIVTRVLEKAKNNVGYNLVIDNDIYQDVAIGPEEDKTVWETLDTFRDFKNDIFFKTLKDKALEMLK